MDLSGPKETIKRARELRVSMSAPERLLWWALRRNRTGLRFRRQHPAGPYVLDFYCDARRLCVEIDGPSHEFTAERDSARDRWLAEQGVRTLRISADEVMNKLAALHEPDMVSGGWNHPEPTGMGRADVNSSIGASWNQNDRVAGMDREAENAIKSGRGDQKMNVKLEPCRGKGMR